MQIYRVEVGVQSVEEFDEGDEIIRWYEVTADSPSEAEGKASYEAVSAFRREVGDVTVSVWFYATRIV